jgi:Ca2+-binding EF-hand superfamily protein
MDTNQDGTLSLQELQIGLKKLCLFEIMQDNSHGLEDCHQSVMDMCDLDGDGKIDYNEFI